MTTHRIFILVFTAFFLITLTLSEQVQSTKVTSIACGGNQDIVLLDDGTVITWGTYGIGNTTGLTPSRIPGLTNVTAIAGGNFIAALKDDGTVWISNFALRSKLEGGMIPPEPSYTEFEKDYPVMIPGLSNITRISADGSSLLAVGEDGTVWGWGGNNWGQLGNDAEGIGGGTGGRQFIYVVTPLKSSITDVKTINVMDAGAVAIKNDGTVWIWGINEPIVKVGNIFIYGNYNLTPNTVPSHVEVLDGAVNVYPYSTGSMIALLSNGTVWSLYSTNYFGQRGDGSEMGNFYVNMEPVPAKITDVIDIVTKGGMSTLVLKSDSTVWAWGDNYLGLLGDGTEENRNAPVQVKNLSDIRQIDTDGGHALALDRDGNLWAWGDGRCGQLGDGVTAAGHYSTVPVKVDITSAIEAPIITPVPTNTTDPAATDTGDNPGTTGVPGSGGMSTGVLAALLMILVGGSLCMSKRREK